MNEEKTTIFLWKNDLTYEDIGNIDLEKKTIYNKNYPIESVNNMNIKILNYIKEHQNSDKYNLFCKEEGLFDLLKEGDINSYIVDYIKWRRCSAYLVIQISSRGHRYLCYFVDKIYHSSQSFGTSYSIVEYDAIFDEFKKTIRCLDRYKLKNYECLNKVISSSINNEYTDINTNFGI